MNRSDVIRNALLEAEQALGEVEKRRKELQDEEEILRREVEGLRLALGAREPKPPTEPMIKKVGRGAMRALDAAAQIQEWKNLPRTEAIERVYAEEGGPLHRSAVVTRLRMKGRQDDVRDVSAALAYLKRVGRAESLGQGRWMVRIPLTQEDRAPKDTQEEEVS